MECLQFSLLGGETTEATAKVRFLVDDLFARAAFIVAEPFFVAAL